MSSVLHLLDQLLKAFNIIFEVLLLISVLPVGILVVVMSKLSSVAELTEPLVTIKYTEDDESYIAIP